jgi:hypothetical protein
MIKIKIFIFVIFKTRWNLGEASFILVNNEVHLEQNDASKINELIKINLLHKFDFWTFFLFVTNRYDELHDSAKWFRITQVFYKFFLNVIIKYKYKI